MKVFSLETDFLRSSKMLSQIVCPNSRHGKSNLKKGRELFFPWGHRIVTSALQTQLTWRAGVHAHGVHTWNRETQAYAKLWRAGVLLTCACKRIRLCHKRLGAAGQTSWQQNIRPNGWGQEAMTKESERECKCMPGWDRNSDCGQSDAHSDTTAPLKHFWHLPYAHFCKLLQQAATDVVRWSLFRFCRQPLDVGPLSYCRFVYWYSWFPSMSDRCLLWRALPTSPRRWGSFRKGSDIKQVKATCWMTKLGLRNKDLRASTSPKAEAVVWLPLQETLRTSVAQPWGRVLKSSPWSPEIVKTWPEHSPSHSQEEKAASPIQNSAGTSADP